MQGRFFGGRALEAEFWDGVTDYKVSDIGTADEEKRLADFEQWLEGQSTDEDEDDAEEDSEAARAVRERKMQEYMNQQ